MKKFLLVLLLTPVFFTSAFAEDIYSEAAGMSDVYAIEEALPAEEREVSGKLAIDGSYDTRGALSRLWDRLVSLAGEQLGKDLKYAAELVAIALLCSLGGALSTGRNISEYINIAGCCAAAVLIAGSMDSIITQASSALAQLSDYSKAAMPALFTAAAACGAVSSASVRYASVCLAIDVIMSAAQRFIIPLIYAYLAISISRSLFDNSILRSAARIAKWCATTLMTGITIVFSGYITITGIIAGSTDAVAVKTARTVISSSLPVVGGIISDAASVVLSAASVIKNSAGAFSLIAVCALCAGPFVMLSVKMLVFRAAAAAADMLPGGRLAALINDVGTALGMLLGLVGCCGIMLFISIMSGIKVVTV